MKVNDFNSKINLPKFCQKLGYTDYQFVRIPTFGWYAYNKDMSFIGNIFDVVSQNQHDMLYSIITKSKPEYLDFDLAYSDMTEKKLRYNLLQTQLWQAAYAYSRKEAEHYKIAHKGRKYPLKEVTSELGIGALYTNGIGVVTTDLLNKFNMLDWPKRDIRGKLLIPTWCTPKHICSLEYMSWDKPDELHQLWLNDEKGWYGNLKHKRIIADMKGFSTIPGNTWDYKVDYWTDQNIYTLGEELDTNTCIKLWTESKNTAFNKSPLQKIIDNGNTGDLKHHVAKLSLTQLQEAEALTGEKLLPFWQKAREQQVQIGDDTFIKRDNCYHIFRKGSTQAISNFTIDVEKIVKRTKGFVRVGTLTMGNSVAAFEIEEKFFTTPHMFQKGLSEKFLATGLGVPILHPKFANKALMIINSFNQSAKIELDTKQ